MSDQNYLISLALAPGMAISIFIYWQDKFEKEPLTLLIKCFFMGILSVIPAIILSKSFGFFKANSIFLYAFISVALMEEFSKFLLTYLGAFRSKNFNEPYDGITYAVMVAMGFASLENVLYVLLAWDKVGFTHAENTAWARMFTAVPLHASTGVVMGYFMGIAKHQTGNKNLHLLLAVLFPAVLHGAYDYCLMQKIWNGFIFGAFISLGIGIYFSIKAIKIHQKQSPFNR